VCEEKSVLFQGIVYGETVVEFQDIVCEETGVEL